MGTRRKELRQAVVHVLSGGGAQPYPTQAGAQVFDTKQDPLQSVDFDEQIPAILVYTDNQLGRPVNMNEWPMQMEIELVIEIAVGANPTEAPTDARLEARLDDIEQEVLDTLFNIADDRRPAAKAFRKMYTKVNEYKSLRMGNTENNNRLAMRGIVIDLTLNEKCKDLASAFPELKEISATVETASGELVTDVTVATS